MLKTKDIITAESRLSPAVVVIILVLQILQRWHTDPNVCFVCSRLTFQHERAAAYTVSHERAPEHASRLLPATTAQGNGPKAAVRTL